MFAIGGGFLICFCGLEEGRSGKFAIISKHLHLYLFVYLFFLFLVFVSMMIGHVTRTVVFVIHMVCPCSPLAIICL